jgi:hypothetical protein
MVQRKPEDVGSGAAPQIEDVRGPLDRSTVEMWRALVEWAAEIPAPPRRWRTDIGFMANETVRQVAWLVEHDRDAAECWELFVLHLTVSGAHPAVPE